MHLIWCWTTHSTDTSGDTVDYGGIETSDVPLRKIMSQMTKIILQICRSGHSTTKLPSNLVPNVLDGREGRVVWTGLRGKRSSLSAIVQGIDMRPAEEPGAISHLNRGYRSPTSSWFEVFLAPGMTPPTTSIFQPTILQQTQRPTVMNGGCHRGGAERGDASLSYLAVLEPKSSRAVTLPVSSSLAVERGQHIVRVDVGIVGNGTPHHEPSCWGSLRLYSEAWVMELTRTSPDSASAVVCIHTELSVCLTLGRTTKKMPRVSDLQFYVLLHHILTCEFKRFLLQHTRGWSRGRGKGLWAPPSPGPPSPNRGIDVLSGLLHRKAFDTRQKDAKDSAVEERGNRFCCRNARAGEMGDPRENSPTSVIVRSNSHMTKSRGDHVGSRTRFTLSSEQQSGFKAPSQIQPIRRISCHSPLPQPKSYTTLAYNTSTPHTPTHRHPPHQPTTQPFGNSLLRPPNNHHPHCFPTSFTSIILTPSTTFPLTLPQSSTNHNKTPPTTPSPTRPLYQNPFNNPSPYKTL
ncbi:hypothetical protein PR048_015875 [Dryococelus australis]|uniref:Uncharacterized protein n=1 Tax=Dryococelus australis TaxID=614101 RepID=A0ABQ9HJA1_9NEOP|nr:hypothetical protein PR048_015875 [Dryococelus australis]